jgi:multiple sugar transport system ATP-binding protein
MKFRTKVDVVESMGSELYVYFDVEAGGADHAELHELAADAGMEDLPRHGDGAQQVVGRLSAESKAAPGTEVELTVDTSQIKLFAADSGRSMTAAAA